MKKLLSFCALTSITFVCIGASTFATVVVNSVTFSTSAKIDRVEKFLVNDAEQTLLSKATVEADLKTEGDISFATREAATAYLTGLCKTKITHWTSFLVYNYGGGTSNIDPEISAWVKSIAFATTADEISANTKVDDDTYNTHMWADCKSSEVRFDPK